MFIYYMNLLLLFNVILFNCNFIHHVNAETYASDISSIQSLYDGCYGPYWFWTGSGNQWIFDNTSDPCLDHWEGITCNNCTNATTCSITELDLGGYNMYGPIPPGFCNFSNIESLLLGQNLLLSTVPTCIMSITSLTKLVLFQNAFSGAFPVVSWTSMNMSMTHLDLSHNMITGEIPTEIIGLANRLSYLEIYSNALDGTIPSQIGNLTKLTYLSVGQNKFNGGLPMHMEYISDLVYLSIELNSFSGTFPSSVTGLSKLTLLSVKNNGFTGGLPGLEHLIELRTFEADNNKLNGTIPSSVGNMHHLTALDFGTNSLHGSIPENIGSLTNLITLSVAKNCLSHSIPESMSKMQKLEYIFLSHNYLTGGIPETISNNTALTFLGVSYNLLNTTIPSSLTLLSNLKKIDLASNSFIGTLPFTIGDLSSLTHLDIYDSKLTGTLPLSFSNLTKLSTLILSSNDISGEISSLIMGSLTKMTNLQISENKLNGRLPIEICNMSNLYTIDLSFNQLTGSLAGCIWDIGDLADIIFNSNSMSGTIPPGFTGVSIHQVILRDNEFSGPLPTCMMHLGRLTAIVIDENRFTGHIDDIGNLTSLVALQIGHNYLSGTYPKALTSLTSLIIFQLASNQYTGTLPLNFGDNYLRMFECEVEDNMFSGPLPTSIGLMTNVNLLKFNNNRFTGTVPTGLTKLHALHGITLNSNYFTGALSDTFEPGAINGSLINVYPILVGMDASDNNFVGTIPTQLFTIRHMQLLVLSQNCFTGLFPANICNKELHVLFMDGLKSGINCQIPILGSASVYTTSYWEDSIPVCLFDDTMPKLITIHLAGNGIRSTIPELNTTTSILTSIDLAHNQLHSTIPPSLLTSSKMIFLDLSYNELTGTIEDMTSVYQNASAVYTYSTAVTTSTYPELLLRVNRLSGYVPKYLKYVNNIDILSGNLFSCAPPLDNIPRNDPDYDKFTCASSNLDVANWFAVGFIVSGIMITLIYLLQRKDDSHSGIHGSIHSRYSMEGEIQRDSGVQRDSFVMRASNAVEHTRKTVYMCIIQMKQFLMHKKCLSIPILRISAARHSEIFQQSRTSTSGYKRHTNINMVNISNTNTISNTRVRGSSAELDTVTFKNKPGSISAGDIDTSKRSSVFTNEELVKNNDSFCAPHQEEKNIVYIDEDDNVVLDYFNVLSFITICNELRSLCIIVAIIACSVYLPLFILLKIVNNGEYSTHTFQYGWLLSSAYISGEVPGSILLCLWLILFIIVLLLGRYLRYSVRDTETSKSDEARRRANDKTPIYEIIRMRFTQFVTNFLVVIIVNAGFIYVELSQSAVYRILAVVLVTMFKLTWNMWVVPRLVDWKFNIFQLWRYITGDHSRDIDDKYVTHKGATLLQYSIVMFNNVVAPCLAVAITDSQCFLNVFIPPPYIVNTVQYQECTLYAISLQKELSCQQYGKSHPVTTQFSPPFIYSYQCSSSLLTNYLPVFMLQFALSATLFPLGRLLIVWYTRQLTLDLDDPQHPIKTTPGEIASQSSFLLRTFHSIIPQVLWPIQWTLRYKPDRIAFNSTTNSHVNTHLLQGRVIIFNIIGAYAVLLTFGLNYPPLAVVIAIAIISLTAGWQIIVQYHISDCYDIPNNEVDIEAVRARLEHDCRRLWKVFTRSSSLLLFSCSFFYGLYFLDTVPGTYLFCFIAIGVPACWHITKVLMKTISKSIYKKASIQVVSTLDSAMMSVRKLGGSKNRHSYGGQSIMLVDINNPIVAEEEAVSVSVDNPMLSNTNTTSSNTNNTNSNTNSNNTNNSNNNMDSDSDSDDDILNGDNRTHSTHNHNNNNNIEDEIPGVERVSGNHGSGSGNGVDATTTSNNPMTKNVLL